MNYLILRKGILLFTLLATAHDTFAQQDSVLIPYRKGQKWGYSHYNGKIIIRPRYDSVSVFDNSNYLKKDIAFIFKQDKVGIIGKKGEVIIPASYNSIKQETGAIRFPTNRLLVTKGDLHGIIDFDNKIVLPIEYDTLIIRDKVVTTSGVADFQGYEYLATKGSVNYIIDSNGVRTIITAEKYRKTASISYGIMAGPQEYDNRIKTINGNKAEIINRNAELIDQISDKTYGNNDEMIEVYFRGKAGVCSQEELLKDRISVMIPPAYDAILDVDYDYRDKPETFLVRREGKITVVDITGKELMPLKYSGYGKWNSYNIVTKDNGKYGFYGFKDQLDIPPAYDFIEMWTVGGVTLWKVKLNGKYGFINKDGFRYFEN